ncbi:hypothetical protein ACROYT_G021764 [Oculina patagonica]
MRQPSSKQATTTADHEFDNKDVKETKRHIFAMGVQVITYRKSEFIQLAKTVASMNLPTYPDFENDSIDTCLLRRLTLPARQNIPDPFQMTSLSNDFSQLPPFGLLGIFKHLIMSKTDYDKGMLSSWRSFNEYNLCLNGHIRSLRFKSVQDLDDSRFFVSSWGHTHTEGKNPKKAESFTGSGLSLIQIDMSANLNPKPAPTHKPVPEMKNFHSTVKKKKRKVTPCDESWVDSFDARPMKHREGTTMKEKIDFANKLRKIDPCSGILHFVPSSNDFDDIENIV